MYRRVRDIKLDPRILKIRSTSKLNIQELQWMVDTGNVLPPGSIILEVGSLFGRSTAAWCQGAGRDKIVICVDTWEGTPQYTTPDGPHRAFLEEDVYAIFHNTLHSLGYYPAALKMSSLDAAKLFADHSLDRVFVDGNHFMIGEDCDAWAPKIKHGGSLCGHDWGGRSEWHIKQHVLKRFPHAKRVVGSIWDCVLT